MSGDSRFSTKVFKLERNLKSGSGVAALAVVFFDLDAGRAPGVGALAAALVIELDAAGLDAPGVDARAVALARLAVDLAPPRWIGAAFTEAPGVEALEMAARPFRFLRALPSFHLLACTARVAPLVAASTASVPPKFLDRVPDAHPDQQTVAVFAASFLAVSARKRNVFLPTPVAGCLANDATNVRRSTPKTVGRCVSASRPAVGARAAVSSVACSRRRA